MRYMMKKDAFLKIPKVLRQKIINHCMIAATGVLFVVFGLVYNNEIRLILPAMVIAFFYLLSSMGLYLRCINERYVMVEGEVIDIQKIRFRKQIRELSIRHESNIICIKNQQHFDRLPVIGDKVCIYMTENTPIYEMEDRKVVCRTLAISRKEQVIEIKSDI